MPLHQLTANHRPVATVLLLAALGILGGGKAVAQTTYYWDSNSTAAGFGITTGIWGSSNFWSTVADGTGATANTTITSLDTVYFGTDTLNYGGATVGIASGGVSVGSIVYGAAQTTSITLGTPGNGITIRSGITVNNGAGAQTISSPITLGASQSWTNSSTNKLTVTTVTVGSTFGLTTSGPIAIGTLTHSSSGNTTIGAATEVNTLNVSNGTVNFNSTVAATYNATGVQTFTTAGVTAFNPVASANYTVQLWGAGGGGGHQTGSGTGGGGGYTTGTLAMTFGKTYQIMVGGGGEARGPGAGPGTFVAGGGGLPGILGYGGQGGGLSGIFDTSYTFATALAIAGGGGGGAYDGAVNGGAGGGLSGLAGGNGLDSGGTGGTQTAGGTGASGTVAGSQLQGGSPAGNGDGGGGGGGGGGYWGGGPGASTNPGSAGGGGSGYIGGLSGATTTAGSGTTPAGTGALNYISGKGVGGASGNNAGAAGQVTITGPTLTGGNTVTLTSGTINFGSDGSGARVRTLDVSAGTGTANANFTQPLTIEEKLKLPSSITATISGGNTFTAKGSNLADNSIARTLTLSGGTLIVSAPPGTPLNLINPPAAAAYSLRNLNSTYNGSAIQVRRSSDNTTQDIGFDSSGNLNTTALLTFVGSGSGFVTTWYDQSGNGRNSTQTTTTLQPRIVNNGIVDVVNTKPVVKFDGLDDLMNIPGMNGLSNGHTISYVAVRNGTGSSYAPDLGYLSGALDRGAVHYIKSNNTGASYPEYNKVGAYDGLGTYVNGTAFVGTLVLPTSGSWNFFKNGTSEGGGTAAALYTDITDLQIARQTNVSRYASNSYGDIFVFFSALSSTDRQTIENNESWYYGLGGTAPSSPIINLPKTAIAATATSTLDLGLATGNHILGGLSLTAASGGTALTLDNAASVTFTGVGAPGSVTTPAISVDGSGTASIVAGAGTPSIKLATNDTVQVGSGATLTINPVIAASGSLGLTKTGGGTLILTNTNSYTGATAVNGGTLAGTGSIAGTGVAVNANGTIRGGVAGGYGTLSVSAPVTLFGGTGSTGGTILTEVNRTGFESVSGGGNSLVNVTGIVNMGGTLTDAIGTAAGNGKSINISLLDTSSSLVVGESYTIKLFTATNFTLNGSALGNVTIDSGSATGAGSSGIANLNISNNNSYASAITNWSLFVSGTDLHLHMDSTPIPEPHHVLLICVSVLLVGWGIRRNRIAGKRVAAAS